MSKGRLETISDAVIAILITIMVLQLRTPAGSSWRALREDVPVLLAYVLSFVNLAVYWNNHHHLIAAVHQVNGDNAPTWSPAGSCSRSSTVLVGREIAGRCLGITRSEPAGEDTADIAAAVDLAWHGYQTGTRRRTWRRDAR